MTEEFEVVEIDSTLFKCTKNDCGTIVIEENKRDHVRYHKLIERSKIRDDDT